MFTPLGLMEKSGFGTTLTMTEMVVECDSVPLTPETMTV
jgi:hypothetical protein